MGTVILKCSDPGKVVDFGSVAAAPIQPTGFAADEFFAGQLQLFSERSIGDHDAFPFVEHEQAVMERVQGVTDTAGNDLGGFHPGHHPCHKHPKRCQARECKGHQEASGQQRTGSGTRHHARRYQQSDGKAGDDAGKSKRSDSTRQINFRSEEVFHSNLRQTFASSIPRPGKVSQGFQTLAPCDDCNGCTDSPTQSIGV